MITEIQLFDPTNASPVGTIPLSLRTANYTGCTSNATTSSRTIITTPLQVGHIVCFDPVQGNATTPLAASGLFKGDRASRVLGWDVTRPATALLNNFAGVVYRILEGDGNGTCRGGLIQIVPLASAIDCIITSAGAIAQGDVFGPVDASFELNPIAALIDATSATTIQATALTLVRRAVAKALVIDSGAVTSVTRKMQVGPVMYPAA